MANLKSNQLQTLLKTNQEYAARYISALGAAKNTTHRMLRVGALKREYHSWHNALHSKGRAPLADSMKTFTGFIAAVGPMPNESTPWTLDRIDSTGDYSPLNCRWATKSEQTANRSNTLTLNFHGKLIPLNSVRQLTGLSYDRVHYLYESQATHLVSLIEETAYRWRYQFPPEFEEALEAEYQKYGGEETSGKLRIDWLEEFLKNELMRLSRELRCMAEDAPITLHEEMKTINAVQAHIQDFNKWAEKQRTKHLEHLEFSSMGPELPPFEPSPPPPLPFQLA